MPRVTSIGGLLAGVRSVIAVVCLACSVLLWATPLHAEDGYALWLRYPQLSAPEKAAVAPHATGLLVADLSPTAGAARDELVRGLGGMLGAVPPLIDRVDRDGVIVTQHYGALDAAQIAALVEQALS